MAKNIILRTKLEGAEKTKRGLKSVDGGLKSLGKSAMKVGGAFFAAQGIISGFRTVIDAAARQELAEKKLEIALGRTSKALLNQASSLQKMTTAGDEAIIEQQAFLASLKFTEDQIKEIIPVALDLSAATGIALESAVRNTAKTFSGLAGELGELIPQLRGLTAEEMKAGDAVKIMADLFGGQAQAQTKTLTGSLEQMKNAISDSAEALGGVLAPAVIGVANVVKAFAEGLSDIINFRENIAKLAVDFKVLSEGEFQVIQLEQALKKMTKEDITAKIKELGLAIDANDESFKEMTITGAVLTDQQQALANMAKILFDAYQTAPDAIDPATTAFGAFVIKQKELLATQQLEEDQIKRLIEKYPELAKALGMIKKEKASQLEIDLKSAALTGQSAIQSMKSVVRAESMKHVAKVITSIFSNPAFPYPINLVLAAGAGSTVAAILDKAMSAIPNQFAAGADFVTAGPTPMLVGEAGPERVQVSPLSGPAGASSGSMTINISGGVVDDDYVRNTLIPALNKATGMGARINA